LRPSATFCTEINLPFDAWAKSVFPAEENLASEMLMPAPVGPCALAFDASAVAQKLVFGLFFTTTHTASVAFCRPEGFRSHRNQPRRDDFCIAPQCSSAPSSPFLSAPPSDCLPDVPLQVSECLEVAGECPQTVRILERCEHGS
jgi:hypothetical protein